MKEFIIDIDGTLLDGDSSINGSVEFIQKLQSANINFLITTNSIKSPSLQVKRLKKARINIFENQIYSPINSINCYLKLHNIKSCFIIGTEDEINQINCIYDEKTPEIIILLDFEKSNFDYDGLQNIIDLGKNGSSIITASKSLFYIINGEKRLDTGSFVTILENVLNYDIRVFGKPSKEFFSGAQSYFTDNKSDLYVIGDDFSTDIIGAKRNGLKNILIKSGKYKKGDELLSNPNFIVNSLNDIKID